MAQNKTQLVTNRNWHAKRRYAIGSTVNKDGVSFQNSTGANGVPGISNDWTTLNTLGNLKIASKGVGNINSYIETNDIVYGLLDDNSTFIPFGKYLGGDLQNIASYNTSPFTF